MSDFKVGDTVYYMHNFNPLSGIDSAHIRPAKAIIKKIHDNKYYGLEDCAGDFIGNYLNTTIFKTVEELKLVFIGQIAHL